MTAGRTPAEAGDAIIGTEEMQSKLQVDACLTACSVCVGVPLLKTAILRYREAGSVQRASAAYSTEHQQPLPSAAVRESLASMAQGAPVLLAS